MGNEIGRGLASLPN